MTSRCLCHLQLPGQSNPSVGNLIDFEEEGQLAVTTKMAPLSKCMCLDVYVCTLCHFDFLNKNKVYMMHVRINGLCSEHFL